MVGDMARRAAVEEVAALLRACGDATRLRILNLLRDEAELCVYDLVAIIGASQPKVSRHLAYLRRAGLVRSRKDGLWVYYRMVRQPEERTAPLLEALGRSFDLLPDLESDLEAFDQRRASRGETRSGHQRVAQRSPTAPSLPVPTTEAPQPVPQRESVPELEVELL